MDSGLGIGGLNIGKDELASSQFDLFDNVEVETGVKKMYTQTFRPISSSSSKGPFTFELPSDPEKFTDAESIRLHGRMRIRKNDAGTLSNLPAGEKVSAVNNIFNSLWSSINIRLNGTEITDPSSRWYSYKSYFENLLSYSSATKENILSFKGFIKDDPKKYDEVGNGGGASTNNGYLKRQAMFAESKWVYFCINIHADITTLRKYIPPNIKIMMELQRNSDEFCLLSHKAIANFKIELDDLRMSVNRIEASADVMNYYVSKIKSGKMPRLSIDRSLLKTYTVTKGRSDLSEHNIISGSQLPDQIIIGIVVESAHRGDITKNPFNFQSLGITEASLVVNGVSEPPQLYKVDMDNGDKADLYASFLENIGIGVDDRECGVTYDDYYGGSFLLVWDRTQDKCNRFHRHQQDSGSIDVHIRTKAPLQETVTVVMYATYSADLILDGDKVITPNF
jgi:hypothetical protein